MIDNFVTAEVFDQFKGTCEQKHKEVDGLERWINKVDNRLWALVIGMLTNCLFAAGTLLVLVLKG